MAKYLMKLGEFSNHGFDRKLQLLLHLLQVGKTCSHQYGWNRYGVHQALFNYSYNNEPMQYKSINENGGINDFIDLCLYRFFFSARNPACVEKFKVENRLTATDRRMFIEPDFDYTIHSQIVKLSAFDNKKLTINHHASSCPNRINPYIKGNVRFEVSAFGVMVGYNFTFDMPGYEHNNWEHNYRPIQSENLNVFMARVLKELEETTKN